MSRNELKKVIVVGLVFVTSIGIVIMSDSLSYAQNLKSKNGLNFDVPEDWPIEKRGGITAPIPIEEYITMKFKVTEEKFQMIKDEFIERIDELNQNIKKMEIDFLEKIKNVQLQGTASVESNEGLTELIPRLDELEKQLGRLDRKITNKVSEMTVQLGEKTGTVNSVDEKLKEIQTHLYKLDEEIDYILEKQKGDY